MKIIGLTGPSGSGKSVLSEIMKKKGIPFLNADDIYHSLLYPGSPCVSAIAERFGTSVLTTDGNLNRKALAKIVFSDGNEGKLDELNSITHGFVIAKMESVISGLSSTGVPFVICDVPLLFECDFYKKCFINVVITASKDVRKERIMKRDGISEKEADMRIKSQKSDEYYQSRADYVVYNDENSEEKLEKIADRLLSVIKGESV